MLLESPARAERTYAPEDAAARRALVTRIVTSAAFAKSNRLSELLKYVYALAEKDRYDEINEQNIGSAVFGRARDYDPGVDSIVRSHASRLRNRLKEYFEQEGCNEALIFTIPRGSYIPAFELRTASTPLQERAAMLAPDETLEEPTSRSLKAASTDSVSSPQVFARASDEPADPSAVDRKTIQGLKIALVAAGALVVLLASIFIYRQMCSARARSEDIGSNNPLWKQFVAGSNKTLVVSSDSGLVIYQHLTGHPVSLTNYMSGDYLKNNSSDMVSEEIVRKLGTRRYTPAVDLAVLDRITHIFGERRDRFSFHYARDLRLQDMKQENAILPGTAEANPWVELFEPSMNFVFRDDLLHDKSQMVNRNPLPGEASHYDSTPHDAVPTIYGVVAYRANISKSGHVLILEGQTMAGTQTAANFVFDDSYLLPFLKKIKKVDGSIPHFELLLRSSSFSGQSSRIEQIAYRVEKE